MDLLSWILCGITDPDPIAMMVVRVNLFTHMPSETNTIGNAWLHINDHVTGVFCLQGLWMNSSTLITMAIGSGFRDNTPRLSTKAQNMAWPLESRFKQSLSCSQNYLKMYSIIGLPSSCTMVLLKGLLSLWCQVQRPVEFQLKLQQNIGNFCACTCRRMFGSFMPWLIPSTNVIIHLRLTHYVHMFITELRGCGSNPCQNGATCFDHNGGSGYVCLCPVDFEGTLCENGT